MSTSFSINLSFPSYVTNAFTPVNSVQGSMGMLISFDCMIQTYSFKEFGNSVEILKVFLTGIFPFIFLFLFLIFWGSLAIFRYFWRTFKRNIVVSLIITFFFLYPTITSLTFKLFKCFNFEPGTSWLQIDMELKCYGNTHTLYATALGIPMFLVWVVGMPAIGLLHLICNWKHLETKSF